MTPPSNQPLPSLREAVDQLFEQSFAPITRALAGEMGNQSIPANLWEDGEGYHLHLLTPGVAIDSVEITAENSTLTVSGTMDAPKPADAKQIWREWGSTTFRRQFRIPAEFDTERCEATYRDGILTVTVPKPEQAKPKTIKVQVRD